MSYLVDPNDIRPSLADGRRLIAEYFSCHVWDSDSCKEEVHDWLFANADALLSLAEAVTKAGAHHGVEDSCLYCDRVRNAAERFRP